MYADDQLDELMLMANVPAKVIDAAKQFPDHVRKLEKSRADQMVSEWRTADKAKVAETSRQVSEDHRRLEEIAGLVESGAITSSAVIDEVARIETRLAAAQRTHAALKNSEARYDEISQDPSEYFDQYYSRFPGLKDRRMDLRTYLAERGLSK